MTNEPQLFMHHSDLGKISPLVIPRGLKLITHSEGLESEWETLAEKAFGMHFSFETTIINNDTNYRPEHTLYLSDGKALLATATATEKETFPNEGWFRMIASDPECRGKGYGKLICLAALHSLSDRGYKTAVLSTDDYRIPAIRTYLSLGFKPLFTHASHSERWDKVLQAISDMNK